MPLLMTFKGPFQAKPFYDSRKRRKDSAKQGQGENAANSLHALAAIQVTWAYGDVFLLEAVRGSSSLKWSQHS